MLDSSLNFESHINIIRRKITSRLFILKKIRWTLTKKDALTLYKSTILPFFDQGSPFYISANKNSLKSLQSLQNRALRIIYGKKNWPGTENAHKECKLLNTDDRRNFFLLKHANTLSYDTNNIKHCDPQTLSSWRLPYPKHLDTKNHIYIKASGNGIPCMRT